MSRAKMSRMIDPAWENELFNPATPALQPLEQCRPRRFENLELDGSASLPLHDRGAVPDGVPSNQIVNVDTYQVATAQLAVDSEVEKRTISQTPLLV